MAAVWWCSWGWQLGGNLAACILALCLVHACVHLCCACVLLYVFLLFVRVASARVCALYHLAGEPRVGVHAAQQL